MKNLAEQMKTLIMESKVRDVVDMPVSEESKDEAKEEVLDEAASDTKIGKLVEAMVYSPRVEAILKSLEMDEETVIAFKDQLVPMIKLTLGRMGIAVTGASTAKKDVKVMTR